LFLYKRTGTGTVCLNLPICTEKYEVTICTLSVRQDPSDYSR
jgi:hypothetical protein